MGFEGEGVDEEQALRMRIAEIEANRVTVGEAYRSIHRGLGVVLFSMGKAYAPLTMVGILVADVALALVTRWFVVPLLGMAALFIWGLYIEFSIEDWVDENNARVDDEVRQVLKEAADENSDDGARWPAGR
jgi:hypothetical protein